MTKTSHAVLQGPLCPAAVICAAFVLFTGSCFFAPLLDVVSTYRDHFLASAFVLDVLDAIARWGS
jgi:hypothetical protein